MATMFVAACGGEDGPGDIAPSGPRLAVDEGSGAVDGVGIGDDTATIERVFGEAPPYNIYKNTTPLGVEPVDLTHPGNLGGCRPRGRENALRYRGVSFFSYGDRTCDVLVTSERATTRRGLSPGDPIERVEELYPELECGETNVASEGTLFEPACWGRTGEGIYIWIGGDPINNVMFVDGPITPRQ
ncbi:MAG: hypothetical protein AABM66_02485 [Actinomycetota bacterium]